jgi:hypothetical protein
MRFLAFGVCRVNEDTDASSAFQVYHIRHGLTTCFFSHADLA